MTSLENVQSVKRLIVLSLERQCQMCLFLFIPGINSFAAVAVISQLDGITLDLSGYGPWEASDSLCVYSDATNNLYDVTITSNEDNFRLENGNKYIPYTVKWSDQDSASGSVTAPYNNAVVGQQGHGVENCGGAKNARLILKLTHNEVYSIPA